jgi:hypothetical protein
MIRRDPPGEKLFRRQAFASLASWWRPEQDARMYAVYQLAFQAEVLFHHSNLQLPIGFERI